MLQFLIINQSADTFLDDDATRRKVRESRGITFHPFVVHEAIQALQNDNLLVALE